jgi:hypothetical protein
MRLPLRLHPDSLCAAVTAIEVDVARPRPDNLVLTYMVSGDIGALRLPSILPSGRGDQLWQHTCFEAFVRPTGALAYCEFNVAPSTQWAAYQFDGYRNGMRAADIDAPQIEVQSTAERYALRVALQLTGLSLPFRLGLSAVIEETSGGKSYWALAHPPGKPDFHHSDCCALELA